MLLINSLTKKYGNKIAVDDISLELKNGEILGFIGPNGAGKTTTIKAVCSITDFDAGEIIVDGISIKDYAFEAKKKIAYVQDNPEIYEFMSGREYVSFIANIFKVEKKDFNDRLEKYAKLFEIKSVLDNPVSTYSHGMKQKISLLSALIHNPKLMILDEPFVGLDPKSSHNLKEVMKEFCKNGGAIFFSSHVLEVVEKLCDKIAIINDGKIVAYGSTKEIRNDQSLEDVFLKLVDNE